MFSIARDGTLVYRAGGVLASEQLVRVDRRGVDLGAIGPPGNFYHPRLSPDATLVAVDQSDETNRGDLWIYEVARGAGTRLTNAPQDESLPVWSPDGRQLAFLSARDVARGAIHVRSLGGLDDERLLYEPAATGTPLAWPLSDVILASLGDESYSHSDIGRYSLAEEELEPLVATRLEEVNAALSPDGRFLAYDSDATGRSEIYVQAYPEAAERWRVSIAGGAGPVWSADGDELFFSRDGSQVLAVAVRPSADGSSLAFGEPVPLFEVPLKDHRIRQFDTRDGETFVVNRSVGDLETAPLTLVVGAFPEGAP
jgi:Tol biopolymer transport system component